MSTEYIQPAPSPVNPRPLEKRLVVVWLDGAESFSGELLSMDSDFVTISGFRRLHVQDKITAFGDGLFAIPTRRITLIESEPGGE